MIIDFHIHTFPDALAERAVKKLSETAKLYGWDSDGYLAEDEAVEGGQRGLFEHCHEAFSAADHQ